MSDAESTLSKLRWGVDMTAEEAALQTGYTLDGGGFKNPRSRLSTLGLIEYPTKGTLRARDILFPESASTYPPGDTTCPSPTISTPGPTP